MPERLVIVNTSPLLYLHLVGHLDLLWMLYGTIVVPPAVLAELEAGAQAKIGVPDLATVLWAEVKAVQSHAVIPAIVDLGLGVVIKAKQGGHLLAVKPIIEELRRAGLWLSDELVALVLALGDREQHLRHRNGCGCGPEVRFGNVLGSDGSVLPLFQWQIARGGPVTVTDPEASRYFMLLSEAAQLVLQAGAMGKGGEVFFLDMGETIRILDLAQNLIQLSGLEPGRDVPIELVGLRPGERLREELVQEQEVLLPTGHEKVFLVQNQQFDPDGFRRDLERLRRLVAAWDRDGAVAQLRTMAGRY